MAGTPPGRGSLSCRGPSQSPPQTPAAASLDAEGLPELCRRPPCALLFRALQTSAHLGTRGSASECWAARLCSWDSAVKGD